MQRGDIRLVDLDPVRGSEAAKRRPAVLVSNDGANLSASRLGRGVVTIVPLTSKAQAEQIRSNDVTRIGEQAGWVPGELMEEIDAALRLHLDL